MTTNSPRSSVSLDSVPYATRAAVIIDFEDGHREMYVMTGGAMRWTTNVTHSFAQRAPDLSFEFRCIEHISQSKGDTPT
jgi:hypothetical protein